MYLQGKENNLVMKGRCLLCGMLWLIMVVVMLDASASTTLAMTLLSVPKCSRTPGFAPMRMTSPVAESKKERLRKESFFFGRGVNKKDATYLALYHAPNILSIVNMHKNNQRKILKFVHLFRFYLLQTFKIYVIISIQGKEKH